MVIGWKGIGLGTGTSQVRLGIAMHLWMASFPNMHWKRLAPRRKNQPAKENPPRTPRANGRARLQRTKLRTTLQWTTNRKTTPRKEKDQKKRKVEEDGSEPEPVPTSEKGLVNTISKYLKEIKGAGWKVTGPQDLTEDMKRDFKKPFPPTEECRLNVYWKRPSVGVHIKCEKKDIATFAVDMECGTFLLRLHAGLKAAALMATRKNLG